MIQKFTVLLRRLYNFYLSVISYISVPSPDILASGIALGNISDSSGLELVVASGTSLTQPSYYGRVTAFKADGSTLWTFTTPGEDFADLVDIGDIDEDGTNEVAATFNWPNPTAYLLNSDGTIRWQYTLAGSGYRYARAVKIGKLRNDYLHKQMVVGGFQGQLVLLDYLGNEIWRDTLGSYTIQVAEIADTDGDGQNEIIIAYDTYVRKYDHLGNQIWSKTLGDIHNDVLAVAVGNVTGTSGLEIAVAVLPRAAGGTVNKCYLLDKDGNEIWNWTPPAGGCEGLLIDDINNDGKNEVIVGWGDTPDSGEPGAGHTGGVTVLDKNGLPIVSYPFSERVEFLAWGDANNDGEKEIIASCDDGKVHLIRVNFVE